MNCPDCDRPMITGNDGREYFCRHCWEVRGNVSTVPVKPLEHVVATLDTRDAYTVAQKPRRAHKYGVKPAADRTFEGIVFDSKVEMERYQFLKALEQVGKIKHLLRQQKMPFEMQCHVPFVLNLDFTYWRDDCYGEQEHVFEDVKGAASTPVFRLKKKLIEAQYGIKIVEVRKDYKTGAWVTK